MVLLVVCVILRAEVINGFGLKAPNRDFHYIARLCAVIRCRPRVQRTEPYSHPSPNMPPLRSLLALTCASRSMWRAGSGNQRQLGRRGIGRGSGGLLDWMAAERVPERRVVRPGQE